VNENLDTNSESEFEFCLRDGVLTVVARVVSAAVAELILRCKTTEGVVERRVRHDTDEVNVRE
jgi:hypothetical protein